ncbi:MAG TPA: hypothetical protein VF598_11210 [Hymenobacter sp.]|jgi:Holliday junction resolvasome RuvABC ATP-dependent DNA helicase subunit
MSAVWNEWRDEVADFAKQRRIAMSALTPVRSNATRQTVAHLIAQLNAVNLDEYQTAEVLDALDLALRNSAYSEYGNVSLNDMASDIRKEADAFTDSCERKLCTGCNGSGEGHYDQTRCSWCNGSGEKTPFGQQREAA